ncbi:phosphoribosylglycinamide formyltransferase [Cerasibacillus terrae]|uniref:Phosphoribosylglycinamide formyltransferase n=1 Tax=Cerasibacillus terrae TaxID=2498845 RepID=A0A5C8NWM0_9BACI|nr:phosphoribosylglycinamide formyltransferase [Cerasibacillus terrae]TXL65666.1 phosphoribosylglycinamide formyltransferase [Cerasibacillus terrae]
MKEKVKAAVFASGTGSNFEAIIEEKDLACEIALLVCDQPAATVIQKANRYHVPTFVFQPKQFTNKLSFETEIVKKLKKHNITWIFLAGYMRLIGPTLLNAYEGKIINIHPSLLPEFPGLDAIGQAYRAKVKKTGVTIHYVDEGMDTGPIIAQEEVPIFPEDSLEQLENRIHEVEHRLYPQVIQSLIK